jgi:hypothetical protein
MKKNILILVLISLLGLTSCVKQKNCDCEKRLTGRFIYYENPKEILYCEKLIKVSAIFIHNITEYPFITEKNIVGFIPKDYQEKDTINVSVCLELGNSGNCVQTGERAIYNIKCINKAD